MENKTESSTKPRWLLAGMALLLHDDEVEALEAALFFVDSFPHASEAPHISQQHRHHEQNNSSHTPSRLVSPSVQRTELNGGDDTMDDEELESLLLEVGLSGSPRTPSGHEVETVIASTSAQSTTTSTIKTELQTVPSACASSANTNTNSSARRSSRSDDAPAGGKTKRRIRLNPNRARDNRKNELAYLRNKVKQMEEQLLGLRQQYVDSKDPTSLTSTSRSIVDTLGALPVWRDMAAAQQLRREKAERENARLKLVLESQIKLAKSMETVMQRRTRQQMAGFNGVLGEGVDCAVPGSSLDLLLDKDTYETLLARAETAYGEVDAVLAANGLQYLETPCTNAQMREGPDGMYVDIFTNKVLPFDFHTAAAAVWSHFRGSEKHRGNLYENFSRDLESSSDTVAEVFAMEFLANDMAADFRVKQVVRRHMEPDRQVVVWVSTAAAMENSKSPFASFGFCEKGYVVIKRPRGRAREPTTTLAKTKRRVKVNPNRARNERKHELAYLKSKVEQMETELEALRHRRHVKDARMREGASGMYLDVFANKLLPFSYEAVAAAVWNHFRGNDKHRGVVYENATKHLERLSDTIMESFTMEFMGKTTRADFRVKQVHRRYVESDRQIVVWVSIGQALDQANSPFSSFGFVDKGYVVTKQPTSISRGHGDFTILQMCSLVSPQMAAGFSIDRTAAGDFTEFVLNVVAANTTFSQELIENVLLEQALTNRQKAPSCA
ncbi:hypothetical protein BBI17_007922 [Phytophthora kernoviae]|uniref:M96 mating-specific protein family n=2 Tax=Phytophthora kernoviae TaxID=325452 RepID=A0A3R7JE42_9STRA|nr:hypothetical protein G195_010876 [Phytophthora kernoviae 00238/432]KAG2508670.1 hypothetical protein JM18_009147 [Phytophthora kernoviae]RLN43719.1 hypothetical protein BBI17_007922 [Phytophthora kernoviae]